MTNKTNLPTLAIAMINAAAYFSKVPEALEIEVKVAEGFIAFISRAGRVSVASKL